MPLIKKSSYNPSYLLSNSHLSTVLPHYLRWGAKVSYEREQISTEDGDFLDLDWARGGFDKVAIITHGLAGDTKRPYVMGMVRALQNAGWDALAWNLRGCGGTPNVKERFYYGGDSPDLERVIEYSLEKFPHYKKVALIGFSLGGNITLRYLGERKDKLPSQFHRAVVFSVPCDLGATADHLASGYINFYMRFFLREFKSKIVEKEKVMPGTFDLELLPQIKNFRDFDTHFNAKWYGYRSVDEFYVGTSARYVIPDIKAETLIISAENDPFLPPESYPITEVASNPNVLLEMPKLGGHVGFFSFRKGGSYWSEERTIAFLNNNQDLSYI